MGRVPIWTQWSIIAAGMLLSPLLMLLAVGAVGWLLLGRLRLRRFVGAPDWRGENNPAVTPQSLAAGSTNSRAICSSRATISGSAAALPEPNSAISSTPPS